MEWLPTARLETVSAAVPLVSATLPITTAPSWNLTVPVAVAGDTAAVNVTARPLSDGFREDAKLTLVTSLRTVTDTAPDVLASVAPSPPYTAVNVWIPAARLAATSMAEPPLRATEPITV